MKKISTLFVCLTLMVLSASADQLWLEENFNYPDGNLEQAVQAPLELHKWMCSLKSADALGTSPQVVNHNLTYPGYIASGQGKVAVLDATVGAASSTQRISVYYMDTVGNRDTVSMYAAFLIKPISAQNTSGRDFVVWEGSSSNSQVRGRLFMLKNGDNIQLGITKNSTTISAKSADLALNTVHLVVMKYEYHPGASNDVIKLWVNPALNKSETENTALVSTDTQTDMIVRGFGLRQRGNGVEIGGLRIGTSWEDVVKTDGGDIPDVPVDDPDVYAVEDFKYTTGSDVEGQGSWVVSTATADQGGTSPMVGGSSLVYPSYGAGGVGGALVLDSVAQGVSGDSKRNTVMPFTTGKPAVDETIYTAMLVNFSEMNSTSGKEFFAYLKQGASAGANTTMRGRVLVKIEGGQKSFAIHKNSQAITTWSAESDKEETALLVVKYVNRSTSSSGASDEFYLYVNPNPTLDEDANASVMLQAEGNSSDGGADLRSIAFRQMKMNAVVDGIRVAKTWDKALNAVATAIDETSVGAHKAVKVIEDGKVLIRRGDKIYTITGQQIQ
jgi:hypothetical protein